MRTFCLKSTVLIKKCFHSLCKNLDAMNFVVFKMRNLPFLIGQNKYRFA